MTPFVQNAAASVAIEYAILVGMIAVIAIGVAALGIAVGVRMFGPFVGYIS